MSMCEYEIKEFYKKECLQYKKLCSIMFRMANENLKNEEEYKEILEAEDSKRSPDFIRMGAFFDGKIYAAIECIDYLINFDGNPCKMSGMAGVVADYNAPFKGALKEVYKKSFQKMRKNGQFLSHLYPFEENYYRQYGYDVSCQGAKWEIPIEKLSMKKTGKNVYFDGSDKMKSDIKEVFDAFSKDKNMMILFDENAWEKFFEEHAPFSGLNSYVHYNDAEEPDGFMSYSPKDNGDLPQNMVVDRIWYKNIAGLKGSLSYFLTQKPYCDKLIVDLPCGVDISAFINSTGGWGKRDCQRIVKNYGLSRVIDVEKILEIAKIQGDGCVTIKIKDDQYTPWNDGTYKVTFGEKRIVEKTVEDADIEMDINAFSAGILGRYSLADLEIFESIRINKNIENLSKVFYQKEAWTEEHF